LPSALEGLPVSIIEALSYDKNILMPDFLSNELPHSTRIHVFSNSFENFSRAFSDFIRSNDS
jgi:hypothetical protein